jgi:hypothetical protein
MLVVLTYEISTSQHVTGAWVWAILIGASATAVGVEAVGILAGHTFEAYWRAGDSKRAWLALALLGVYTVAGLVILWGNWALMPIPIIAAVVYLVSGLAESLTISQAQELAAKADEAAFERQQMAEDRALARELKRQAQVDKTAVKLAQLEAKAVTKPAVTSGHLTGQLPDDFRLLTPEQKDTIASLTSGELAQMAAITDRTARRWKEKVSANGYHK